ncbi:MAG: leucine-rich repeat domain-containing protein, partial [Wenyingzhuangia sp.]|uniref:leucine-rich repeat domain-containing protein n=1 Tax=Wenyingzhuangia sp. TaxID=1964193 RepID=UPI00321BCA68
MKNHLFAFAMFTISFGFSQTTFSLNDIEYTVTDETEHTVETTAYTGSATDVNIPALVTHESIAYSVTSIGNSCFYNKSLTSVTIPNSVIRIGPGAFSDNALLSVDFPNSVVSICYDALAYNSLTSVSFSNNIITISSAAFRNNSITSLIIPASVTSIGASAFLSNPISSVTSLSLNPFPLAIDVFGIDRDYTGINLVIPTGTATAYATAG